MSEPVQLKRSLSLALVTFYGLGTIIGAGIYVLVGAVARQAGLLTPWAFVVSACIAAFSAMTYSELASRYPRSAGEAVYVQNAFRRKQLSVATGVSIICIGIVSCATIINGFIGYFKRVFAGSGDGTLGYTLYAAPDWLVITIVVILLGGLAIWGISQSVWFATVATLLEIGGLLFVVLVASTQQEFQPLTASQLLPSFDLALISGVLLGAFLAFYAFIGFEDMVNVAEEVRNPRKNLPRAIIIALIVSTLIYVVVALVAVYTVPVSQLAASRAPLADMVKGTVPHAELYISIISMVAVVNGALVQMIMASRVLYGMGVQGMAPRFLSRVNPVTRTPVIASVLVISVILSLAVSFKIEALATATSYITLLVFALMHATLWRLKITEGTHPEQMVKFRLWVPVTGLVLTLSMVLMQTWNVLKG